MDHFEVCHTKWHFAFIYYIGALRRTKGYFNKKTATGCLVREKPGYERGNPTTISTLKEDLPTYGQRGRQHGQDLNSQRLHLWENSGSLRWAKALTTSGTEAHHVLDYWHVHMQTVWTIWRNDIEDSFCRLWLRISPNQSVLGYNAGM